MKKHSFYSVAVVVATFVFLAFQFYRTFMRPLPPMLLNSIHLLFVLLLCFLYMPLSVIMMEKNGAAKPNPFWVAVDIFSYVGVILCIAYFIIDFTRLNTRIQFLDPLTAADYLVMFFIIIAILEGVRRTLDMNLVIFVLVFVVYAWVGPWLPGVLYYKGTTIAYFADLMVMGSTGIFGSAVGASASFLFWFIVFGALFSRCGGGDVLIDIGMRFSQKGNAGPAKAAVIASGLLGMVSGSGVANVTGTGVITIPMMKEVGYKPEEAGAIEAVASTGGQIMPPIMGTGAFLMAEMLGIDYFDIAMAALIPALVYYGSVFMLVTLMAKRYQALGLGSMSGGTYITKKKILPRLHQLLPVVSLIYCIVNGHTLTYSALVASVTVLVVGLLNNKQERLTFRKLYDALMDAGKNTAVITIPTGACAIIIAIVINTGLATKLATLIANMGISYLWIALIITMLGCMVLGMALPPIAAYLTGYILFVPTLLRLGIPLLVANLFIYYFGIFAQITPPVCITSFTAAGIAKANAWKTGWTGFRYATVAFLVPFVFVYNPGILLHGSLWDIVSATAILATGTFFLTAGVAKHLMVPITNRYEQILTVLIGIIIIIPESISTVIGLCMGIALFVWHFIRKKRGTPAVA